MADNHGHVQVQKESEPMGAAPRVLVVDDNKLVQIAVGHALRASGLEVLQALDGDEAILMARTQQPDIALLDIRMDGKSGFEVADYLRDVLGLPFMFLSAFADEATIKQVKELGALTYLVKPLDIQQIVPAVEAAFANRPNRPRPTETSATPHPTSATSPLASPIAPDPLNDTIALAVGIVMHRYSLTRRQAFERLQQQAKQEGGTVQALGERLISAQEVLAGLGSI